MDNKVIFLLLGVGAGYGVGVFVKNQQISRLKSQIRQIRQSAQQQGQSTGELDQLLNLATTVTGLF